MYASSMNRTPPIAAVNRSAVLIAVPPTTLATRSGRPTGRDGSVANAVAQGLIDNGQDLIRSRQDRDHLIKFGRRENRQTAQLRTMRLPI